jgi:hypothetical protein
MNPLALVPLRWWLTLGAVGAVLLSLWGWGRHRYNEGAADKQQEYEAAAVQQREINAKASFRAVENTAVAVSEYVNREATREIRYVKDQAAVADVWRYADRLRDELARRSAAPVEATAACGAEQRRVREAEGIVGEHTDALATCARLAVESRDVAEKLANKLILAKDYIKALP